MMNRMQVAEQFRKALQMFAASLTDEQAMEVVAVYDNWKVGKAYAEFPVLFNYLHFNSVLLKLAGKIKTDSSASADYHFSYLMTDYA